ncbi:tagatose-6-phosphate kinase [Bacillus rubiinfantis]|uniref:tagatose-6-phosphate kinase n=1 Tax=Bacillus rubiinfantis TaxID=1499680 RepID=UPI0005A75EE6|nr:tagatose-6-phosphate kinase [Bacillus rubiinfantis]
MILTVTMNPSVDISYPLEHFLLDGVNRVENVRKTAGGKGLNVTRVIAQMNEAVLATGVLGGTVGDYIIQELNRSGIANSFLKINKESRNCIAILHEGKQTEILEAGPTLTPEEGAAFLEKFSELLAKVSLVTISGSLPRGLAPDYYQKMISLCRHRNIPVIIDTSGESLRQALLHEDKPTVIKPNLSELAALVGRELAGIEELQQALKADLFQGIDTIVVSLGSDGAFVKHGADTYRVLIPQIDVVNPVGSGDATVAGLAVALNRCEPVEATLKTAMTTGMLNAMEAETGSIGMNNFSKYFQLVKVERIPF